VGMTLKLLVAGLCAALMGCGAGGGADGNPDAGAGGGGADDRGGAGAGGDGGVPDAGPPGMPTVTPAPEFDSDIFRQYATLVELADGRVFVAGGFIIRAPPGGGTARGTGREEIEIFDVANRTYVEVAPLKQGRLGASSVLLPDGNVLVTGGAGGPPGELAESRDSAELFDPLTGDTTLLRETMNNARRHHGSWLLASGSHAGKVLIAGGATRGAPELYDPATGMFTTLGATNAPPGGANGDSVLLDDEQVVFLGTHNELSVIRGYHRYDPETGAFDDLGIFADSDYSRYTVTKQHDGRVLIAGGTTDGEGSANLAFFDPSDDSIGHFGKQLNGRRYLHSAGVLPSGRVALISGYSMPGEDGALSTVAIWDPVAETVTDAAGEVSVGRAYSQALTLTSGQIFVIGGQVVLARGNTAIVANVDIISE
jgi:hypothetical protein